MAIVFSSHAPADDLRRLGVHFARVRPGLDVVERNASDGIETWILDLEAAARRELDRVRPGAWRYLVFSGHDAVVEAHIRPNVSSAVSATVDGPVAHELLAALAHVEMNPVLRAGSFEARVLLVPGAGLVGLWLRTEEGEDHYVPFSPVDVLGGGELVPASAFAAALADMAKRQAERIAAAPGPSGGTGDGPAQVSPLVVPRCLRLTRLQPGAGLQLRGGFEAPYMRDRAVARELDFALPRQERSNWCWAAIAAAAGRYCGAGVWQQCAIVSYCLDEEGCCGDGDADACDAYGYLQDALEHTQSLADFQDFDADADEIQAAIDDGRPVGVRIRWYDGGAHFVVITGYRVSDDDTVTVTIRDPRYGTSRSISLEDFPATYQAGGQWTHTYFCRGRQDA